MMKKQTELFQLLTSAVFNEEKRHAIDTYVILEPDEGNQDRKNDAERHNLNGESD